MRGRFQSIFMHVPNMFQICIYNMYNINWFLPCIFCLSWVLLKNYTITSIHCNWTWWFGCSGDDQFGWLHSTWNDEGVDCQWLHTALIREGIALRHYIAWIFERRDVHVILIDGINQVFFILIDEINFDRRNQVFWKEISHCLQCFSSSRIYAKWCRSSSINSIFVRTGIIHYNRV